MSNKILVIDDDKKIAQLVRSYLEDACFRVLVAYDLENAYQVIRYERPDLIILDLTLPDGDGRKLLERIRSSGDADGAGERYRKNFRIGNRRG
jgi:DNA-binding response OmpR family regulator